MQASCQSRAGENSSPLNMSEIYSMILQEKVPSNMRKEPCCTYIAQLLYVS